MSNQYVNRYSYYDTVPNFLKEDRKNWIEKMKSGFDSSVSLPLDNSQLIAWKDCFNSLQKVLSSCKTDLSNYYVIFEYCLPYESGRRPDVVLLSNDSVVILEYKQKPIPFIADEDQTVAYHSDICEYHFESRERQVSTFLVLTQTTDIVEEYETINVCSDDLLSVELDKILKPSISFDPIKWIDSKYEPLPTIVESARMIMDHEELPNIRRVNSTCIPQAIECLGKATEWAKENKRHVIAFVTGVPGAGKTFLGLQFVYKVFDDKAAVNSVYLSGNGPLIQVLSEALHSRVFVNDLHKVIIEYINKGAKDFHNNVIVFDEGQRAWDISQMAKKRGTNLSEPDAITKLAEERLDWCVLLVLVGEGQEINRGENSGIVQWNEALKKSSIEWGVLCPDKLKPIFAKDQHVFPAKGSKYLDLTVSLRSHLAGDVSTFVNHVMSGEIEKANALYKQIRSSGFQMLITRDLDTAKDYCRVRYSEQTSKRYGLIASAKGSKLLANYGIKCGFQDVSMFYIGKWFNADSGHPRSCCQLNQTITEFHCQGLELDMPIVCWSNDMVWNGKSWNLFKPYEDPNSENNTYRKNAYRVLLTRGRDGFIIYFPDDRSLDVTYELFAYEIGIKEI